MANFTYYTPWKRSEIDPKKLRHKYYVQLAPDGDHLVLGMLQQSTRPSIGKWMDVTNIDRDLPDRYFVQYTGFNTLVPGSLIEGHSLPKGKWKEIKRTKTLFHRVVFDTHFTKTFPNVPFNSTQTITTLDNFILNQVVPVVRHIHPGIPNYPFTDFVILPAPNIRFNLYYFKGTYQQLGEDKTKLQPFTGTNFKITLSFVQQPYTNIVAWETTIKELIISSAAANGTYSLVVAILDDHGNESEYIFMENIVVKTVA